MFNRILTATDQVTVADGPVISAARMARRQDARLYLLHVMESSSTDNRRLVRHFATGQEQTADAGYTDRLREALTRANQEHLAHLAHEVRIAAGFPWEEILRWATEVDADLVVLGPHASRAQEQGVVRFAERVGSTVENVITRDTCPVMVVNRAVDDRCFGFRKILVAVDFSRSCACAVGFAARLAVRHSSRLWIFHMIPVPPFPKYSQADFAADREHARQRLEFVYAPLLAGCDHRFEIGAGVLPHQEMLACADGNQVDLIVMGSHTKETEGKWYPGSVVERVTRRAACPVMVVTDPTVLTHWDGSVTGGQDADNDHRIQVFTRSRPLGE